MSPKLSLIFVCILSSTSLIRADDTSTDMILRQTIAENSPDLHLVLQVSEILQTVIGEDELESEKENAIEPLWKSIITTLGSSEGAETFRIAVSEIEKIINDDDAQRALINIFATFYTCLMHGVLENGVQLPIKNTMIGNSERGISPLEHKVEEILEDSGTNGQFRIVMNSESDSLNEVLQEFISEEGVLRSGQQSTPRSFDGDLAKMTKKDFEAMWFGANPLIKSKQKKENEKVDELKVQFLIKGGNGKEDGTKTKAHQEILFL